MSILCKLGLHKWGKATFVDHSFHSSVLDYKQRCLRCGKKITWVQPKGINQRFYPISWSKRNKWILWILLFILAYLIYWYTL